MSESNLEDRAAIHDLFTRYCCALDNGEIEAVVDCFTVDAVLKSPVIDISGRDEIRAFAGRFAAQRAAGVKIRSSRLAALAGIALVVVIASALTFFLNGETAAHAKQIAAAQLGPGYHYHVNTLNVSVSTGHKTASAVVVAWNDTQIREIPVHWEEQ